MPSPSKMLLSAFLFLNLSLPVFSAGTSFITEACTADTDCAEGCCAFNTGKCAGPVVALQRDGGCGFGNATPNDNAAQALGFTGGITSASTGVAAAALAVSAAAASPPAATSATSTGSGKAPGTQFITGTCSADSDCASTCCAFKTGKCAAVIVANESEGGCGFGQAAPVLTPVNKRAIRGRRF